VSRPTLPASILVAVAVVAAAATPGCKEDPATKAAMITGGDPRHGKDEVRRYGCPACHTIPEIPGANALVGPPLDHMASRSYLAGTLPNTPDNMRTWILHPQGVKPGNAMPDTGMSEASARDITAFLYTLE
jgi:cytochrome c